jgi:hypothetical protein
VGYTDYVLSFASQNDARSVARTLADAEYVTRIQRGDGSGTRWQVYARVEGPPPDDEELHAFIDQYLWPLAEQFGGSVEGGTFEDASGARSSWTTQRVRGHYSDPPDKPGVSGVGEPHRSPPNPPFGSGGVAEQPGESLDDVAADHSIGGHS